VGLGHAKCVIKPEFYEKHNPKNDLKIGR